MGRICLVLLPVMIVYYDSNNQTTELKQVWMDQVTRDDPDFLKEQTEAYKNNQQIFKHNIEILKRRFNQTGVRLETAPPAER
ncbi:hypothetical protein CRUP_007822 [Coryphaenoides rupestris]|nr:hypothetical protein CRUP_007822 [Coryphaenoides rupestris]